MKKLCTNEVGGVKMKKKKTFFVILKHVFFILLFCG